MKKVSELRNRPSWHESHAKIRTDAYVLLATLLNDTPTKNLIDIIRNLRWNNDLPEKIREALDSFNRACNACSVESIAAEFQRLFVGLGSGELIPYGSWYQEKTIQSTPLAAIRSDLARLGIVKMPDTFESEDHAGALCEVMALLSNPENNISASDQATFFELHIAPWMPIFFKKLQMAKKASFYRSVGGFGLCFLQDENEYLQNIQGN